MNSTKDRPSADESNRLMMLVHLARHGLAIVGYFSSHA